MNGGPADPLVLSGQEQCVGVPSGDGPPDRQIAVQRRLAGVIEVKDPHLVAFAQNAHGLVLNVLQIQSYQLGDPESAVEEQGQDGVIALLIFTVHGAEQILALLQRQIAWQFLFQLGRVDIFDRIFTK